MKILVISDFHGKIPYGLKKFVKKNEVDLILSPGDFYGGYHSKKFEKIWEKHIDDIKPNKYGMKNIDGLKEFISKSKYKEILKKLCNSGKEVLKYLNNIKIPVIVIAGNCDNRRNELTVTSSRYPVEELVEKFHNIEMLEYEIIEFDKYKIFGFGATFPFAHRSFLLSKKTKKRTKENIKKLRKEERENLKNFLKKDSGQKIILSHVPPKNTKLDEIKNPKNPWHGRHVGDDILMRAVKKYQPLLNVCGHMHENQGKIRIGKTLVVNSGYGKKGEFALIDITGTKVKAKLLNLYE
ncbi:MAG: metallophosphoesterase [Candidatus Aenigmarchaeota archaeon]|nr:metallophosphoesterase [Candidatus Aenigmarchaeota archaeon]